MHRTQAMSGAYSDERMVRATPGFVRQHESLLVLVKELRELWKDAGASLATPDRQASRGSPATICFMHPNMGCAVDAQGFPSIPQ